MTKKKVRPKKTTTRAQAKRLDTLELKTKQAKETLLAELEKIPIVYIAVQRVGVSRSAYYEWRQNDAEFTKQADKALKSGRCKINDLAESKVISKIQQDNLTAAFFWLKNNNPRYSDRRDLAETETEQKPWEFEETVEVLRAMHLSGFDRVQDMNKIYEDRFMRAAHEEALRRQREMDKRRGLESDWDDESDP